MIEARLHGSSVREKERFLRFLNGFCRRSFFGFMEYCFVTTLMGILGKNRRNTVIRRRGGCGRRRGWSKACGGVRGGGCGGAPLGGGG